jgi:hypothetical protein
MVSFKAAFLLIKKELELELIQTQMAKNPMPRVEEYARALRASQNAKRAEVWGAHDVLVGERDVGECESGRKRKL